MAANGRCAADPENPQRPLTDAGDPTMNDSTSSTLHGTLRGAVGDLFARATAAPAGAERSRLVRWLLIAAAVFLVWKAWRGLGGMLQGMFWAVFGLAWVLMWTRPWQWF
jgi:hypothetical protein